MSNLYIAQVKKKCGIELGQNLEKIKKGEDIPVESENLPERYRDRVWKIRINGGKMLLYIRFIRKAFKIRMEMESVIFQELSAD